jgi:hypothetical protein
MPKKIRTPILLTATLATLGAGAAGPARGAAEEYCELKYARADNMWGSVEDATTRSLKWETIRLEPGQKRVFATDWKYEKMRNDGTNYYGSHLRIVTGLGTRILKLTVKRDAINVTTLYVEPNRTERMIKGDIIEVACP